MLPLFLFARLWHFLPLVLFFPWLSQIIRFYFSILCSQIILSKHITIKLRLTIATQIFHFLFIMIKKYQNSYLPLHLIDLRVLFHRIKIISAGPTQVIALHCAKDFVLSTFKILWYSILWTNLRIGLQAPSIKCSVVNFLLFLELELLILSLQVILMYFLRLVFLLFKKIFLELDFRVRLCFEYVFLLLK